MSTDAVGAVQAESTEQAAQAALEATETAAADAASAAASESTETQTEPKDDGDKQKRGIERRFAKVTAEARALEAERDHWKRKALGEGEKSPTAAAEPPKKPNPSDFETTEAYLEARDEWLLEQASQKATDRLRKEAEAETRKSAEAQEAEEWNTKKAPFAEKTPDYQEVTAEAMQSVAQLGTDLGDAIADFILVSDLGPQLLYHLGQNPEDVAALKGLHPAKAIAKLGVLEARLAGDNAGGDQKPPLTRAPRPVTPVRKPSAAGKPFDPLDPSSYPDYATYEREMNKREKRTG